MKPKTKTTIQSPFTAETATLLMDRYLDAQEKRDARQHQRNLELLNKMIHADFAMQKSLVTVLHAATQTLITTLTAISNTPPRTEEEMHKHFEDVVHPMMKEIGLALEFAPPHCDEGFMGYMLDFERLAQSKDPPKKNEPTPL